MTNTAEAPAADPDTSDTTNPIDDCAANATDTMSANGGITPCISKWEYVKHLHPLMTKQPIKIGKSLGGEKLITHRQGLYGVMKARNPIIYIRDHSSECVMTIKESATNQDYYGRAQLDRAYRKASTNVKVPTLLFSALVPNIAIKTLELVSQGENPNQYLDLE